MSYYKYAVEIKRLGSGWHRGAIWSVPSGHFRGFLEYINKGPMRAFVKQSRVRRIHGAAAEFNYPEDKICV